MMISVFKASVKEGLRMTVVSHKITTCPPSFLIYKLCCTVQFSLRCSSHSLPEKEVLKMCTYCDHGRFLSNRKWYNSMSACNLILGKWQHQHGFLESWKTGRCFSLAAVNGWFNYWYLKSCREGPMNPHQTASQRTIVSGYNWCMALEFLSHYSSSRKSCMMQISCSCSVHSSLFKRLTAYCSADAVYHFRCTPQNSWREQVKNFIFSFWFIQCSGWWYRLCPGWL